MKTVEDILEQIKNDKICVLEFWFVDLLGNIKSVEIPVGSDDERLKHLLGDGILCDIASLIPAPLIGKAKYKENYKNVNLAPDLATYLALPWTKPGDECHQALQAFIGNKPKFIRPSISKARFMCDIRTTNPDKCFSSRQSLKDYLFKLKASNSNWEYIVGPELEFHYLDDKGCAFDEGGYMDTEPDSAKTTQLREMTALMCETIGIKVECHHHEVGHGQQEIDFEKRDALTMADNMITYKLIARDVARLCGVQASFMPKPFSDAHGNGMHVHQSIWNEQQNLFYGEGRRNNLSLIAERFTAGLLTYASEITAITNQWVNSYKRIVPSYEAPVYIAWGSANRSSLIRIPKYYPVTEQSVRIEYRSPDPACNPYLAFLVMLAAGMEGIKNDLELPSEIAEDIYHMPESTVNERNIGMLPSNLGEALAAMKRGSIVKDKLGEQFMEDFVRIKEADWVDFNRHVSRFEIEEMRKYGI